jgi:Cu-Zn family superoxide dismutase
MNATIFIQKFKMKTLQLIYFILLLLIFNACEQSSKNATAIIQPKSNSTISGKVTFIEKNGIVTMTATIANASEGNHAIHIHAEGDCSAPDGKSAGGHWNPTNKSHGKWEETPFHRGDIGNIVVGADGKGTISRETDLWCIGCEDETKNIIGKAIIIHQGPDDFTSQPAGAAGARIGCGVIE